MKNLTILLISIFTLSIISCSRSGQQRLILSEAERIAESYPDSALVMVKSIDVSDIKDDENKALYALAVASAHKVKESSMASDSLTRFAFDYYRDKDSDRHLKGGNLYALHRYWSGDGEGSLLLLDSLIALPNISDSIEIELLRSRIVVGGFSYDCHNNVRALRKLLAIDSDSALCLRYKEMLYINLYLIGQPDTALTIVNDLIRYAKANNLKENELEYNYEKLGILEELGKYEESNHLTDSIMSHASDSSILPYLHFWKALNHFNMGNIDVSAIELASADSCIANASGEEKKYYESFAGRLRDFIQYRKDGKFRLLRLAALTNSQRNNVFRMESIGVENEKNLLIAENRALELKSQNQRKTAIIIIVILIAAIIGIVAVWNIQKRKRRIIEAEERVDALGKMIEELKQPLPTTGRDALRRAMLQQLGIIKMVAETPTEQNREMLRKISSIESDTNGSLINWENLYEIIDNLYSDFHKKLHAAYAETLTEKEEQVIVLFVAGFSAKEISVITSQSTASIYVRKSSVKKKLNVPENEDVIAFIRHNLPL